MRRDDLELGRDAELVEDRDRRLERREVRAAAADDADDRRDASSRSSVRPPSCRRPRTMPPSPDARGRAPRRVSSASAVRWPILRRSKTSACRTGGGGRPGRRGRPPRRRAGPGVADPCPSRLTIAVGLCAAVSTRARVRDGPDVLLELRGRGALDRPVAGVVDARRELVDDQRAVAEQEQLRGQRAAQVHRARPASSPIVVAHAATSGATGAGATDSARIPASWRFRAIGKAAHGAIERARDDDRQLGLEVELALGEQGVALGAGRAGPRRRRARWRPRSGAGRARRSRRSAP